MAYVLIDHSQTRNPDGSKGTKVEYDCVSCPHCQSLIAITIQGVGKTYESPYRCRRCHKPICKFCGEKREGQCTPFGAVIERTLKHQKNLEWVDYHYRTTTR